MEPVQPVITNGTLYYNSIINESMAGIKTADIMAVSSTRAIPELVSLGIMAPLDEYLDFESPLLKVCQHVYNGTMWKGKHYGLRNGMATNGSCLINYNKDIIEREGQPDILDLTENGQWNWETMLDIARNCTKDNNGDGILDQYGICSSNNWVFVSNLLYSNGSTGIDVRDGKLVYALDTPQAIRAIQYAIDLAFVHKVYIGNISPWRKATVAMLIINSLAENFRNLATYGLRSYATVLPKGPDVSESQNFGAQNYYAVSTLSEYKKEITQIMAEIFVSWDENGNDSPELEEALNKVVPYSWFWDPANNVSRYYSSEREFLIQKNAAKTFGLDYLGGITGLSGFLNTNLCTPVFNGSMSASQVVGAIADPVQSNYLDPYNK